MRTSTMRSCAILVGSCLAAVSGFATRSVFVRPEQRQACKLYGASRSTATMLEGKQEKVATVKELLDKSEMIFRVPADSLTVAQTRQLRDSLPEGTTMSVVKNTLMRRAMVETPYEPVAMEVTKGSNMWFFIEEDIGATLKAFETFAKETEKAETHFVKGGVVDGQEVTLEQIEQISKLPSKVELIAKAASGIKSIPTKLARLLKEPSAKIARVLKEPNRKVVVAIKLATEKDKQ